MIQSLRTYVNQVAARMVVLPLWRRYLVAFILGIMGTLAMPPFFVWLMLVPMFMGLLHLLNHTEKDRHAFGLGWFWGLGYFVSGLYWIGNALLVPPAPFKWAIPVAVLVLPAYVAIYSGLALYFTKKFPIRGLAQTVLFACLWSVFEWLRGHAFTGFPWNLVGYTWRWPTAQGASVMGIYGLSFLTVLAFSSLHLRRRDMIYACLPLIVVTLFGLWRLGTAQVAYVPDVTLRLVQPNVPQQDKWNPALSEHQFNDLIALSKLPGHPTHIIWPEAATSFNFKKNINAGARIAEMLPADASLITGALRNAPVRSGYKVSNSILSFDSNGQVTGFYDKTHLVPFGEYVPYQDYIPELKGIAAKMGELVMGHGLKTMEVPGLPPFSPLICYEAIFPNQVTMNDDRPQFLLNLTNDAWYGYSTGPYQHLAIARMRAIEEGLPIVRVANTGITALFDAYGDDHGFIDLGERGILDAPLPTALKPTIYAIYGDKVYWTLIFAGLLLVIYLKTIEGLSAEKSESQDLNTFRKVPHKAPPRHRDRPSVPTRPKGGGR